MDNTRLKFFTSQAFAGWIRKICKLSLVFGVILLATTGAPKQSLAQDQDCAASSSTPSVTVKSQGPVIFANGDAKISPMGKPGSDGLTDNFFWYVLPGEGEAAIAGTDNQQYPHRCYRRSYLNSLQPIQTSDWWNGVGLQWYSDDPNPATDAGWINGRKGTIGTARSAEFLNEPVAYQFYDLADTQGGGITPAAHGLSIWNQNALNVRNDGFDNAPDKTPGKYDPKNITAGRAFVAANNPVVTVGLLGVHPLGLTQPAGPPWSAVQVNSYSDWGVQLSYTDAEGKAGDSKVTITMANGSPFTWFEQTGSTKKSFVVWAGAAGAADGTLVQKDIDNTTHTLVITVKTVFNADNNGGPTPTTASYAIYADAGDWKVSASTATMSIFQNDAAQRVAVLALPHRKLGNPNTDFGPADAPGLAKQLSSYACAKITGTTLDYPPIPGSQSTGFGGVSLGYDSNASAVRYQMRVATQLFPLSFCTMLPSALQVVFPHQLVAMSPVQRDANPLRQYVWNGVIGELTAFEGNSYTEVLTTGGVLPFLPSVPINAGIVNPTNQAAAEEDLYNTLKNWFYQEEGVYTPLNNQGVPVPPPLHSGSFANNFATYEDGGANTYIQKTATLFESMVIADQLAQSKSAKLNVVDPDFGKNKTAVAAEMRDYTLSTLKELIGQWAEIYSTKLFQYNTAFNSIFGYPPGYGSVQNFADHHFHYGYFLKAVAAIGRYDEPWLESYMPLIQQLQADVANFDRTGAAIGGNKYPFLRSFSPFYGHSWADGTGANGNNQESTSEDINFSAGMLQVGQALLSSKAPNLTALGQQWINVGMYLYEQEVLAAQQYWYNQTDATKVLPTTVPPSRPLGTPPVYVGNWPDNFVTYAKNGNVRHSTLVGILRQRQISKSNFFAPIDETYAVQLIPLSASSLFVGRSQDWLKNNWTEYLLDSGDWGTLPGGSLDEVLISSLQARVMGSGTKITDPGPSGALARLNNTNLAFQPYATKAMGKDWAYAMLKLGQLDPSVVANTPSYAVFTNGGQRTFIAYNASNTATSVKFVDTKTQTTVQTLNVAPLTMQTAGAAGSFTDKLATVGNTVGRLYLHNPVPPSTDGTLTGQPGTQIPVVSGAFPTDSSALAGSRYRVQARCGGNQAGDQPPSDAKQLFQAIGHFKGNLIGSSDKAVTQFEIHVNNVQTPGWQRDPKVVGNQVSVRLAYYWNNPNAKASDAPDRSEVYQGLALTNINSFTYSNKLTQYRGNQVFGNPTEKVPVTIGGSRDTDYPATANGTVILQIWGTTGTADQSSWVCSPGNPDVNRPDGWYECTARGQPVTDPAPRKNICVANPPTIPPPGPTGATAGASCTKLSNPTGKQNQNYTYCGPVAALPKWPFDVSVDAAPNTNRASWIKLPYGS